MDPNLITALRAGGLSGFLDGEGGAELGGAAPPSTSSLAAGVSSMKVSGSGGGAGAMDAGADGSWDPTAETVGDRKKFAHATVLAKMPEVEAAQRTTFDSFVDWTIASGASYPDLYFKCYAPNVNGVHTRVDVRRNEQIMAIPLDSLITDEVARATPLGQRLVAIEHKLSAANHNQIIVFLLDTMERGDTKWQQYYDVLPSDFSNFPIFWEKHELAWLQGSDLAVQAAERRAFIREVRARARLSTVLRALPACLTPPSPHLSASVHPSLAPRHPAATLSCRTTRRFATTSMASEIASASRDFCGAALPWGAATFP